MPTSSVSCTSANMRKCVIHKIEALQDQAQDQRCFMQRELAANTLALAIAERLVGIGRQSSFRRRRKPLWIKRVGARPPHTRVPVQ